MVLLIIDTLLSAVFEIVLEFLLGIFGEFLFEYGLERVSGKFSTRSGLYELLLVSGHAVFGIILGIGSTYIYSDMVIENQSFKVANFILMPLIFGFSSCLVASFLDRSTVDRKWFQWAEFLGGVVFGIGYIAARALTNG
ncbi:MAG: hypothetical protein KDB79_12910 [Acidobacteria bacterium]|nr:hypothetical protein [Acidobacteriota bacterium]